MGKTATNISVVLGLITIAFTGYYLYTQRDATTLNFESNEQTLQNMLKDTRVFIQHRKDLNEINIDIGFFVDPRFTSLRSFTTPIKESTVGRPDPFADIDGAEEDNSKPSI